MPNEIDVSELHKHYEDSNPEDFKVNCDESTGAVEICGALDARKQVGTRKQDTRDQEDILTFQYLDPKINNLPDESLEKIPINAIKKLNDKVKSEGLRGGSCWVSNIFTEDKIITSWVGDSRSYLVHIDDSGTVTVQILTKDHKPSDPVEKQRIESNGGFVFQHRLAGVLAVSRAIGDNNLPGITHDPDVQITKIPKTGRSFVITACDGLTEKDCLTSLNIGEIVNNNKNKSSAEIADMLVKAAYKKGSKDNISCIVTNLNNRKNPHIPRKVTVCDGHNGPNVSHFLEKNEGQVFKDEIEKAVKEYPKVT